MLRPLIENPFAQDADIDCDEFVGDTANFWTKPKGGHQLVPKNQQSGGVDEDEDDSYGGEDDDDDDSSEDDDAEELMREYEKLKKEREQEKHLKELAKMEEIKRR